MNQETITATLLGALCAAACSSTSFGTVMEEDGGRADRGGSVELLREGGADVDAEEEHEEAGEDGSASDAQAQEFDSGADATPERPAGCAADQECPDSDFCRWGVCTHVCLDDAECPDLTLCSFSSSGADLCFPTCASDFDCVAEASCVDGICTDARDVP